MFRRHTTRSVWRFDLEHDPGQTYIARTRTILAFRDDRIHTVHFIDGLEGEGVAGAELDAAAQSLSYRRRTDARPQRRALVAPLG